MDLKSGVKSNAPMPVANTSLPLGASCISTDAGSALTLPPPEASSPAPAPAAAVSSFTLPWASSANLVMRKMGTASDTMDGTMSHLIVSMLLMLPLIQSMVVVTSPMGVQAPPALAARTTAAPKNWRRSGSLTSLRRSETMTMVLVRLSRMALMKKVMPETIQRRDLLDVALMTLVTSLNPWCASTISTMVIAPRRKNITWLTSAT
mmetsp:Transcript_8097/g.20792  ORF Transcript_8097/g.20792 Transcript_8097/m.20792 type:complete len:206 (+) Transcript_8097:412-1029(+)